MLDLPEQGNQPFALVGIEEHPIGQFLHSLIELIARLGLGALAQAAQRFGHHRHLSMGSHLHHLSGGVALDQLARRALGHDLASVHHYQAVAQLLGLVHVVGGEHLGHPLAL